MEATVTRIAKRLASLVVWIGLALVPVHARAADPLTMFLLGFAQNLITSAIESYSAKPNTPATVPPMPAMKPPASMDDEDLRVLVDESFVYLTSPQREELLAGLHKALSDPANAAQREAILTEFVNVARQIQYSQRQLNRLSDEQKRTVANRFAGYFRTLTPEQQQALLERLRLNALPLPADLNEMMLAALAAER